jgi:lipopolysaccharide export LptBFGC system permease protein LptF
MKKHPSNAIFYVIGSILLVFGIYIAGSFVLQLRQSSPLDATTEKEGL